MIDGSTIILPIDKFPPVSQMANGDRVFAGFPLVPLLVLPDALLAADSS